VSKGGEAPAIGFPGQDRPALGAVLELVPTSSPDTLVSWMEGLGDGHIAVSAPKDSSLRLVRLPLGEQLDLVWSSEGQLRSLPVVLTSIEDGAKPCWHLRPTGAIRRGQRRQAVRAPMTVPVGIGVEPARIRGTALDLSEGGLRCVLEIERPPDFSASGSKVVAEPALGVGEVVRLTAGLPDLTINCLAEITRHHPRTDGRQELSTRFIGLSEHEQDAIRALVFARLRQLRQRGLL
jgi:hypothetical protein